MNLDRHILGTHPESVQVGLGVLESRTILKITRLCEPRYIGILTGGCATYLYPFDFYLCLLEV
eukprot:COSAG02_NODE_27639_length_605_cov_1.047431_1_plen_63_part_01